MINIRTLENRDFIRQTWYKSHLKRVDDENPLKNVKILFLMGLDDYGSLTNDVSKSCSYKNFAFQKDEICEFEQIYVESRRHGDILVGDFIQQPRNNSLRNVFGLTWVLHSCPEISHFGKYIGCPRKRES